MVSAVSVCVVLVFVLIVLLIVNRRKMRRLTRMVYNTSREEVIIGEGVPSNAMHGFANPVYGDRSARHVTSLPCQVATPAYQEQASHTDLLPPPYQERDHGATGGAVGGTTPAEAVDVKKVPPMLPSPDPHTAQLLQARLEAKARELDAEAEDGQSHLYSTLSDVTAAGGDVDDDDDDDDDNKKEAFNMW